MTSSDNLSSELEAVEKAIDAEYMLNPLITRSFSEAAWYFLAFCEERHFKEFELVGVSDRQEVACIVDEIVNSMKTPMRWLWRSCGPGERIPRHFSDHFYQASWDFTNLAQQYLMFESAYTYARAGALDLVLHGETIVPSRAFLEDTRFEAYDRLCIGPGENPTTDGREFFEAVAKTVRVDGPRFSYQLNPAIVAQGRSAMAPVLDEHYWLPSTWELPRYTFGDFHSVISVLRVLAIIHEFARVVAARQGCIWLGYAESVLIMQSEELSNRLRRYTGLAERVLNPIINDLTYGQRGMRHPDPALQPLIPLTKDRIALPPTLLLGTNSERNFTVLLNRLPEERAAYSRLSTERESLSREYVIRELENSPFRFWNGPIPGRPDLPDIDLAIVDDRERACLLLELKSFVGPAETREILEKSEEIKKGIAQIRRLRDALSTREGPVGIGGQIPVHYCLSFAVASETFVGTSNVQDASIPVVRTSHLVRQLRAEKSLSKICAWLDDRAYLPREGRHYEVRSVVAQIGHWKLQWYGLKPLICGDYAES